MAARPPSLMRLALLMLLGSLTMAATPSTAQQSQPPSPYQRRCPRLAPANNPTSVQPLRIQPGQVPRKNARGCLSPADAAVYGPDGCPVKLCHAPQGTMPLPQL